MRYKEHYEETLLHSAFKYKLIHKSGDTKHVIVNFLFKLSFSTVTI